jgi:hypothetical protein
MFKVAGRSHRITPSAFGSATIRSACSLMVRLTSRNVSSGLATCSSTWNAVTRSYLSLGLPASMASRHGKPPRLSREPCTGHDRSVRSLRHRHPHSEPTRQTPRNHTRNRRPDSQGQRALPQKGTPIWTELSRTDPSARHRTTPVGRSIEGTTIRIDMGNTSRGASTNHRPGCPEHQRSTTSPRPSKEQAHRRM